VTSGLDACSHRLEEHLIDGDGATHLPSARFHAALKGPRY
jgi:hypothetical protein